MELQRLLCQNGFYAAESRRGVLSMHRFKILLARQKPRVAILWALPVFLGAAVFGLLQVVDARAAVRADPWLTGDRLERRLSQQAGIAIQGRSLRHVLRALAKEYQLAVMLDRRLDPDRRVGVAVKDVSLRELIYDLARQLEIGVTWLGPVAYFGPREKVGQLRTVCAARQEEISRLPPTARQRLQRRQPLQWGALSRPDAIFRDVAEVYGLQIDNLESLPHDLWASGNLPPLDVAAQLTLLGAGFDFTFELDAAGERIRLDKIPPRVTIERIYPVEAKQRDRRLRQLSQQIPDADVQNDRGRIRVRGRIEDHEQVVAILEGSARQQPLPRRKRTGKPPVGQRVYSLRVDAALRTVLVALSRQIGFKLQFQSEAIEAARIDLDQIVSVEVKDLKLDALLHSVLEPAGLTYRQEGDLVEILPAAR